MTGNQLQNTQQSTAVDAPRNVILADFLMSRAKDFQAVKTVDADKFLRVVKNAVLRDPEIAEASKQSVYLECMKAINDGLVLDGREAALTRFKVNKKQKVNGKWVDNFITEVVYIPMVAGIMKRVRASGEIRSWTVELVYEEEYKQGFFKYRAAPDPIIEHEPIIVGNRGPVVAAYSSVKLSDGSYHYEVMTLDQLNAIKMRTKSKKAVYVNGQKTDKMEITGPWATDEEEMFRKTVIRRHAKRLPVSSAVTEVIEQVDKLYDLGPEEYDREPDGPQVKKPAPPKSSAAARLKKAAEAKAADEEARRAQMEAAADAGNEEIDQQALDGDIIDGDTGEVISEGEGLRQPDPDEDF